MVDCRVEVELGPLFSSLVRDGVDWDDVYVITYETHDDSENSHWQVAAVARSLSRAEQWLRDEATGKSWSHLSHLEGSGTSMRLITNFSEQDWSALSIRKYTLL